MNNAYYIAANSMMSQEKVFSTISGNIANINTNGYKKTSVSFSDLMYSFQQTASSSEYSIGSGITVNGYDKDFQYGNLKETGSNLDIAFEKDGFLTLTDGDERYYTRGGNFILSATGEGYFISNNDGFFLLDSEGNRVQISQEERDFEIDSNGVISFKNSDRVVNLAITSFENPEKLQPFGNNLYIAGLELKENTQTADIILRQGFVEQSNVDIATEMTDLIQAQRLYQMHSKILQVMDEISGMANRLRK